MNQSLPVIIATRGSPLAMTQSSTVLAECRKAFPGRTFELKIVKTTGDRLQTSTIMDPGTTIAKGLFTKELEVALLNGEADIAVHSLKDLPTDLPSGLMLGAVSKRADVRDVLICKHKVADASAKGVLGYLPQGATIGTCSTRRASCLKNLRPDLKFVELRGNVLTRIQKVMKSDDLHATVLAAAGLSRLGYTFTDGGQLIGERIPEGVFAHYVDADLMLPCVGQAALGIEIRLGDEKMIEVCSALNDADTHSSVVAERAFLAGMGGGCQSPVAAYARVASGKVHLKAISFTQNPPKAGELTGAISEAESLGTQLAKMLKG